MDLKRKRSSEDASDVSFDAHRRSKRTTFTQLPFRTSPSSSQDRIWHNAAPAFSRPLTPVDSSDDEAHGQAQHTRWHKHATSSSDKRPRNYRIPSVTIEPDHMDNDEMDIGPNIVSAPVRQINLLSAPIVSLDERAPTPITATFNIQDHPSRSHSRQTSRHTILSPVMAEEPYLPSPIEIDETFTHHDPGTAMVMERAHNGFGALSVACKEEDMMEAVMHHEDTIRAANRKVANGNSGRNAKLHMGFRADCEKCQQRVPGHYSHILWS